MPITSTPIHLPFPWNSPMALGAARHEVAEALGRAPCHLCGQPLVVRLDRQGPYFYCKCRRPRSQANKAA
ncbi:MAG: hypothetical protein HY040_01050 [Planctomycetes bacterium]|nr:hypothetical protein [Planctomycetota bacterium]